ncbi:hypothetical protein Tsubulata_027178 [Turnera subulata]|uniref:Myb-like domain-containing protein n=1 Tax=Turnera subulata TaxID=218843 RepID=A0A9Q0GAM8_9ROSI|nr:hypothetical protein Tsubulata_027178 [Turnera subulata]
MANSSGTHHHQDANHARSAFNGANPSNGNSGQESSGSTLKHNPGISTEWTVEEQAILEEGLVRFASESVVMRYAKIALQLQNKNVRDVALRCRWMTVRYKKENSKRRKEDNFMRKSKDKKERYMDTSAKASHFMANPNVPPFAPPMLPTEYDETLLCDGIGGVTGELLKQNAQAFNQISANFSTLQIQDNIGLLHQTRENLLKLMKEMDNCPEIMKQMPPLPVKLDEELANTILPRSNLPRK